GPHQTQMPVDRVLIERNQEIDAIAEARHLIDTGANRKKSVPATNDRLIRVVRINVESAAREDLGKDIPRRRDTLSGRSSDRQSESTLHRWSPYETKEEFSTQQLTLEESTSYTSCPT